MKICWDNLNKLRYSKRTGKWYRDVNGKIAAVYVYKEECEVCKEPFISQVKRGGDTYGKYCTIACGNKVRMLGKKLSPEACEKISKIHKNKITSEETKKKLSESLKKYYGNYDISISKYDVYAHQLEWCEEVRRNEKDPIVLEVRCAYNKCRKWYIPTLNNVSNRIQAINGKKRGEHRFYCSEKCKDKCPIYGMRPEYLINRDRNKFNGIINCMSSTHELSIWKKEVLKRVGNQCEMCGSIKNINVHHEYPQKTHQIFSLDPDNGIVLCKKCHYKYGHSKNTSCSTGKLAMI